MSSVQSQQLREQAKALQLTAKKLLDAADALESLGVQQQEAAAPTVKIAKRPYRTKGSKRLKELKKFLTENPGRVWSEIMAGVAMPKGTLAFLLKEKNGFHKDDNGKWSLNSIT